ncbi:hypothetical protein [Streptomyces sp. NPDC005012]|uniref:hypothetical protein n=1 Tax=unclassified Streptomyces TaxID=2593676 RepID=UPI0033AA0E83
MNAPARPDPSPAAPAGKDASPDRGEGEDQADALRAELERLEHKHAQALTAERHARELAAAEAQQLRARLTERAARIDDLQQALRALTAREERMATPQPSSADRGHGSAGAPGVAPGWEQAEPDLAAGTESAGERRR